MWAYSALTQMQIRLPDRSAGPAPCYQGEAHRLGKRQRSKPPSLATAGAQASLIIDPHDLIAAPQHKLPRPSRVAVDRVQCHLPSQPLHDTTGKLLRHMCEQADVQKASM